MGYYSITGKELPFADEVQEDTPIEKLNDLYHTYESLPSDLKEDYGELMCYFTDLDEMHRYRKDIIHYSWRKNVSDVARHILNNDPAFTTLSESVTCYFDYEAYGSTLTPTDALWKPTTVSMSFRTAFLETFFKLYPTATDNELAYYVEGNALEPINGDYLFSELVNPVFTADGNNVTVRVAVKFIDNQTRATQVSQYELTLHKDSNWKIID